MVDREDSAGFPPDACFCVMLHGVAHARGEGCPPVDVQHTCFAGPILEDRCAVCNKEFRTDVQRPTPPLTEAELAEMEQFRGVCGYLPDYWKGGPRTTDRLFATIHAKDADLRAARERIKELEKYIADEVRDYLGG